MKKTIINRLMDEVEREGNSPRNQAKKNSPSPAVGALPENIFWAQLFDYHMQEFYDNPCLNLEMQLRQKLFQLKNLDDDGFIDGSIYTGVGQYLPFTLLGLKVYHQKEGVAIVQTDHPLMRNPDLDLLPSHIDFYQSGDMPHVHSLYQKLKELVRDRTRVIFPIWNTGPLDLAIQFRGYENFMLDTYDRPQFVHSLMDYLTDRRIEWWKQYLDFVEEKEIYPGLIVATMYLNFLGEEEWKKAKGAELAEDWAYIPFITPEIFQEFALPYYVKLAQFHKNIAYFHSCGNLVPLQKYLLQLPGMKWFENNKTMNLEKTLENIPPDRVICVRCDGNRIPRDDEKYIRKMVEKIVSLCEGRRYIILADSFVMQDDKYGKDIDKMKRFIKIAKQVLGR